MKGTKFVPLPLPSVPLPLNPQGLPYPRQSLGTPGREFCSVIYCYVRREYTLWLSGGWRAAEVAEGRRGSELLRCCPQSAFPESPLPRLLIEHALATSVLEFGRRESICIALECRDERLGEYALHFCCIQRVNVFASSGKWML